MLGYSKACPFPSLLLIRRGAGVDLQRDGDEETRGGLQCGPSRASALCSKDSDTMGTPEGCH